MYKLNNPLSVLKAISYVAWADQKIASEERQILEGLIASLKLSPEEKEKALSYLKSPPGIEEIAEELDDPVEARFALVQSLVICHADSDFCAAEEESVQKLADALGFSTAELEDIKSEVAAIYNRPFM